MISELSAYRRRSLHMDKLGHALIVAIAGALVTLLVAFVGYIAYKGVGVAFSHEFLLGDPQTRTAGIAASLFDSFYLLMVTMLVSIPLSLGAALFLVGYAGSTRFARFARIAIETLSSLPSIVVGMFGALLFVQLFGWGISLASGALTLSLFNIPILVRVMQRALEDVPSSQTDAALALGLTRWEALVHVVIPAAIPAIVTGVVVSAGRVFGEAAALIFTSGSAAARINFASRSIMSPTNPFNLFRPAEPLAVHIWRLHTEPSIAHAGQAWATALVLVGCVLLFNLAARLLGRWLSLRSQGAHRG